MFDARKHKENVMYRNIISIACASALALSACQMTTNEQAVVGGLVGAGAGLITAKALDANHNWTIIAVLAGAAAGTMVARNSATNECAYANGDGTYRTGPCP